MATNLRPITQTDFSGGMNAVVNPFLISQRQVSNATNLILDEHGSMRTRDGFSILTLSPDTVGPIYLRGNLTKSSGQELPFAIQATIVTPGTVGLDTTATGNKTGSSGSINMTLGATAKGLIVVVSMDNNPHDVSSITYDGKPLTKIGAKFNGSVGVEVWGLIGPTVSVSKPINVNLSGSPAGWRIDASSWTEMNGWGTSQSTSGNGGTGSLSFVSDTTHKVFAAYAQDFTTANVTPNGTSLYEGTFSDNDRAEGQYMTGVAAPGTTTITYSGISSSAVWAMVGVDLTPTGTGYTLYKTDDSPWTTIGTVNAENLPDYVGMIDKVIIIHGYATPKSWDGTSFANITAGNGQTVPPGAKHGIFHLGALWLYNTNPTTTTLDGPSSLRASDANDPNSWPNANQTFIARDDGQVGMGLASFTIVETGISPTATLIAFKNYSTYQITGVFGASNFSLQPIKSDMGCIAPRTIQFVSGFGLIRLTHKGFALYNGVEDRLISEEIRPVIFGGKGYSPINQTTIAGSWASQSQNPPLYIAACPVGSSGLNRIFVYDLVRRGWTIMTLPISLSTMKLFLSPTVSPVVHAGTSQGGWIIKLFDKDTSDNGADISWTLVTKRYFSQNQMQLAYWRRAVVDIEGPPNTKVSIIPYLDGTARQQQDFNLPDSSAATIRTVLAPDIVESAHDVQLIIIGTKMVTVRGIELHASAKPLTRFLMRG